ncbi:pre-toxin TG domain-containing protein [Bacillus sp. FSL W7-1360]
MVSVLYNLAAMGVNPAVIAALAKELDAHVGRPVSQGIIQTAVTNGVYQPSPGAEMHAAFPIDFMYNGGPRSVMEAQGPEWYYIGEAMPFTAQSMYLRQIRAAISPKGDGVDLSNASSSYEASHMVNQPKGQTKYHSDDWGKSTSEFEWGWSLDDTSMAADFTPGVSNFKSGIEAFTGYDPITGRKLEPWERSLAMAAIIGGPAVKGASRVVKGVKNADTVIDSVPSVRNGEFDKWYNSLNTKEFDEIWSNPQLRNGVKDRLRHPGGLHEWHLVSRADTFKYWGVTSQQIREMRTLISETKFINPPGKHGGKGSTKAHNELLAIIDTSTDYNMFKRRLQNWADYRFEGGSKALPKGLKP